MAEPPPVPELLQRWHGGDAQALGDLVAAQLPWLQQHAERRLGPFLRERGDAADYLQDALLDFLRSAPRFQVRDEAQLRALLMRVLENTLRDRNDWFRAKRRHLDQLIAIPSDSVLDLHSGAAHSNTPSRDAGREENRAWVRLALELLDPAERQLLIGRDYDGRSFDDLGQELGITAAAARMRWARAVQRLAEELRQLRRGGPAAPETAP